MGRRGTTDYFIIDNCGLGVRRVVGPLCMRQSGDLHPAADLSVSNLQTQWSSWKDSVFKISTPICSPSVAMDTENPGGAGENYTNATSAWQQ